MSSDPEPAPMEPTEYARAQAAEERPRPTPEVIDEYHKRIDELATAQNSGAANAEELEADLIKFMRANGLGEEG